MKIKQLINGLKVLSVSGNFMDEDVLDIACDSRSVQKGTLFVAVRGSSEDGHHYIEDAIKKGAIAIIFDDKVLMPSTEEDLKIAYVLVEDSKLALNIISDIFYGCPYQNIKCVGITGTNGKTTVSYLIRSILNCAGLKSGLIGTLGYQVENINIPLGNTTPGVVELHKIFKEITDADLRYVVMEVSSHSLGQARVCGIHFKAAIFTNLTQDHLDYHKSMEEYFLAKQQLFKEYASKDTSLIINKDDVFGQRLLNSLISGKVLSYGFSPDADVCAAKYELCGTGSKMSVKTPVGEVNIATQLVGKHNIYNILSAVAFSILEGISLSDIKNGIEKVTSVKGRLDRIASKKGFNVFIDYAHTDDALKNVLESLRVILHNGRIITVFGCGGDRDKGKRPKMGRVAATLSDYCIVTSDNPRSESPEVIIEQIVRGIEGRNFEIELDRYKAIEKALKMAGSGDFVLIAGKGHESYQVIKDKILHFDDSEAALKIITELERG